MGIKRRIKRKLRALKAFLIILLIIVVGAGATYGLFIFSPNTATRAKSGFNKQEAIDTLVCDSLDFTTNEEKGNCISPRIKEENINALLATAVDAVKKNENSAKFGQFLTQMYIDVNGNKYDFHIELYFHKMVQLRVSLLTELNEVVNEEDFTKNEIEFTIKNLKIGKIGLIKLKSVVEKFVTDEQIENVFSNAGLNIKVSLKDMKLTYNELTMMSDISKLMNDPNSELYFSIAEDLLSSNLINFNFNDENSLGVDLSLVRAHTNAKYQDSDKEIGGISPADVKSKIRTLADNGVLTTDYYQDFSNYLIHGYTTINDSTHYRPIQTDFLSKLSSMDLSSIGINDVTNYDTMTKASKNHANYKEISDCIRDSFDPALLMSEGKVATITEEDINNFIGTIDVVGNTTALFRKDGDSMKANYIIVNNFYCDIVDDTIAFVIGIDINGYATNLVFEASYSRIDNQNIVFKTEKVYYGNIETTANMRKFFNKVLSNSFHSNNTVQVNFETEEISFNFASGLSAYQSYLAGKTLSASIKDDTSTASNGSINIKAAM